ncbi:MAG: hypothetical protein H0W84_00235 [Bacteroidetes bacterium]|nr:hypothetical protein [Bacteroidota bacterium]
MESKASILEPLIERAEEFGKTSLELLKLKSIDKTAAVASTIISRLYLAIIVSLFMLTLNIAIALWLGDLLGKLYYGFFVVAAFYGLFAIVLFFIHPYIKARTNTSLITQLLN